MHTSSSRRKRCGKCRGCRAVDCGHCKHCLDMPKFGGPGTKKQRCINRTCEGSSASQQEEFDQQGSTHTCKSDHKVTLDYSSNQRGTPKYSSGGSDHEVSKKTVSVKTTDRFAPSSATPFSNEATARWYQHEQRHPKDALYQTRYNDGQLPQKSELLVSATRIPNRGEHNVVMKTTPQTNSECLSNSNRRKRSRHTEQRSSEPPAKRHMASDIPTTAVSTLTKYQKRGESSMQSLTYEHYQHGGSAKWRESEAKHNVERPKQGKNTMSVNQPCPLPRRKYNGVRELSWKRDVVSQYTSSEQQYKPKSERTQHCSTGNHSSGKGQDMDQYKTPKVANQKQESAKDGCEKKENIALLNKVLKMKTEELVQWFDEQPSAEQSRVMHVLKKHDSKRYNRLMARSKTQRNNR